MIHHGDCLDILRTLPDCSVDSLVTDPPAGISFMNATWDHHKGGRTEWVAWMRDVMAECLRVMKPGAHGLVWALPRTSHWTACALEDAGFEIRDSVYHLFGSGFPKSLDVSKAIDKAAGAERKVVAHRKSPYTGAGRNHTPSLGKHAVKTDDDGYELHPVTTPSTDAAKHWSGWGTALKPATEKWILVRKPGATEAFKEEVWYAHAAIGAALCRLLPAKSAKRLSTLSPSDCKGDPSASARWFADALNTLGSLEPSEMTGMFSSPEAASTFLSIATSWSAILEGLSSNESTFTTRTEIALTTGFQTLRSLLSTITHESTPCSETQASGSPSSVSNAGSVLSAVNSMLHSILITSVHSPVTSRVGSRPPTARSNLPVENGVRGDSSEIWLVRKPLSEKTVAANVQRWGTGALNIDGSRIRTTEVKAATSIGGTRLGFHGGGKGFDRHNGDGTAHVQGRFPSHLLLSHSPHCEDSQCQIECAVAMLDAQSGAVRSAGAYKGKATKARTGFVSGNEKAGWGYADSGGASRFFYCAKISASERGEGNKHPTVKSQKLMRYLCRMVTPPGGTVLDPFTGSGSTGVAAKALGFKFIGIEREAEYVEIAERRIEAAEVTA